MRSSPTNRRTPSRRWWTACSPRRATASAGAATGWTSRATPTTSSTPRRTSRTRTAFRYRDWVIRRFNDDMPYDLFVKAQIAGDC